MRAKSNLKRSLHVTFILVGILFIGLTYQHCAAPPGGSGESASSARAFSLAVDGVPLSIAPGEIVAVNVGGSGVSAYKYVFTSGNCLGALSSAPERPSSQPILLQTSPAMSGTAELCILGRFSSGEWQSNDKAFQVNVAISKNCLLTMYDGTNREVRAGSSTSVYRSASGPCEQQVRYCNGETGQLSGEGNFDSCDGLIIYR